MHRILNVILLATLTTAAQAQVPTTHDMAEHSPALQAVGVGQNVAPQIMDDSLYLLPVPLTDSHGLAMQLGELSGRAQIVTLFYADCQFACPLAFESLRRTLATLPASGRSKLGVLAVSLNAGIDTPAKLAELAGHYHLNPAQYRLAVSDSDDHTRLLAAALGIKYRKLADGSINHSTRFVLLDGHGVPLAHTDQLNIAGDAAFMAALRTATR
jgi:protein SCO1/2